MFYTLAALTFVAFVLHLVLLDRLQRYRLEPLVSCGWWSLISDGQYPSNYDPRNYSSEGRQSLKWVYATGVAWLVLVGATLLVGPPS